MFAHLSKKSLSAITTMILLLCIALEGCSQAAQNTATSTKKTNQPVSLTPVQCNQSSCHGIRPYIDTWNNIHLEQIFSYNINNAADIAKYYDFVWGADQN